MNNQWNKFVYKCWAPIYDKVFNSRIFLKARKKVFQKERFIENQNILFVGVGTGADLELIRFEHLNVTAIDYSDEMLEQAIKKFNNSTIRFEKMDAQNMNFDDNHFDVIVGSLILSVVPQPDRCFNEMVRVLKPNGKMIIFDKFSSQNKKVSILKKVIRPCIKLLGTDIAVNFEKLLTENKNQVLVYEDIPIMFEGMYRKIVIVKTKK